jgi:hypothetical protein
VVTTSITLYHVSTSECWTPLGRVGRLSYKRPENFSFAITLTITRSVIQHLAV